MSALAVQRNSNIASMSGLCFRGFLGIMGPREGFMMGWLFRITAVGFEKRRGRFDNRIRKYLPYLTYDQHSTYIFSNSMN